MYDVGVFAIVINHDSLFKHFTATNHQLFKFINTNMIYVQFISFRALNKQFEEFIGSTITQAFILQYMESLC